MVPDNSLQLIAMVAVDRPEGLIPASNFMVHLESCTPGQDWAKWYVLVCTSTYQYKTVQVSTRIPNLYIPVCTSTYRYVLLRSQVVF
jgi:hypothetical protein